MASCSQLLVETVVIYAAHPHTYIYVKLPFELKICPPADHQGAMSNRHLLRVHIPGAYGRFASFTTKLIKGPRVLGKGKEGSILALYKPG